MKSILLPAAVAAALLSAGTVQAQGMDMKDHGAMQGMEKPAATAAGTGTVKRVKADTRTVNLAHDPIPAIGWPNMVMDFKVADGVDLSKLEAGQQVEFELEKQGKAYIVTSISPKP